MFFPVDGDLQSWLVAEVIQNCLNTLSSQNNMKL